MKPDCKLGAFMIRLVVGPLFIITGTYKLLNPQMIIGLLESIGFPFPVFLGWLVLLSELIFGVCVLLGFKLKYSVWPLIFIMLVATVTVILPGLSAATAVNFLFHLLAIASLVSLFFTGAGKWFIGRE